MEIPSLFKHDVEFKTNHEIYNIVVSYIRMSKYYTNWSELIQAEKLRIDKKLQHEGKIITGNAEMPNHHWYWNYLKVQNKLSCQRFK
jgi:hypothetical protein